MGTRFELLLPGSDEVMLRAAGEAAIDAIEATHAAFTRFEASSLVTHIRRVAPAAVTPPPADYEVFAAAEAIRRSSGGAFDVRRSSGGTLEVQDGAVAVSGPDVELDFGAIAKGFGIDRAVAALREAGVESGFVHGGTSSMFGFGTSPAGGGWRVALGDAGAPIVELRNEGMAMAATLMERDGQRVPHLRTGRGGPLMRAPRRVAVVGPSAGWADGWATAVALFGKRPPGIAPVWRIWRQDDQDSWRTLDQVP